MYLYIHICIYMHMYTGYLDRPIDIMEGAGVCVCVCVCACTCECMCVRG